jgi:branched-subunit amino acid ABC-type transport system permease component
MAQVILFNVTNGLIIGAFYVLMALGLSLILNLSNVINFAHGNDVKMISPVLRIRSVAPFCSRYRQPSRRPLLQAPVWRS